MREIVRGVVTIVTSPRKLRTASRRDWAESWIVLERRAADVLSFSRPRHSTARGAR